MIKQFFLLICFTTSVIGSDYSVIASKNISFSTLTSQQIRDIYLQKRHTVGDQIIIPVNLLGQDELRIAFESSVLGMNRNQLSAYWSKQHFQGIKPPITQPSFESINIFIQNVEGAIGYIPSTMVNSKTKVIYEF